MLLIMIVLFVAWLAGWCIFYRLPFLAKTAPTTRLATSVSIIIPVRNEVNTIPKLLRSIQKQTIQPQEIIVVDDASTDGTAEIAKRLGTVVFSNDREQHGKAAACWLGATHAKSETFLFLDADTFFQTENSLERLLAEYEKRGKRGLMSLQPFHQTFRFYEQFSFIFNVIILVGLNTFSVFGEKVKAAGAFGPCILCSKIDYFQVDGHNDMPSGILDDMALAKRFLKKDLPIHLYGGKELIAFRMYPEGFKQLIQGWTKDFATASRATNPFILFGTILWIAGGVGSVLAFRTDQWQFALVIYCLYVCQCIIFAKRVGNFTLAFLLFFPIFFLFFLFLFLWSLIQTYLLKSVTWKGRKIKF
ncbi:MULTISPECIES: glycosyltransferase family 2 protein [Enterococcus]|uniref:4,4'-diaponeurosporenoate glycosyltransferase n=2 Tax=Enterococcus mundtii TaxID=53346 RepID=A0A2T5DG25_ENTMU|nr:glycosyltransferase family 2 protein [Enterococcus mundtii]MBE6173864.1 glycosyltransferase [Enterococcus faecium]MBO1086893.1 glycosyltransferase [Enterococcus mundtii]MDB7100552.1 glycosyltransferase family 2 protein [Enterococcus mundtii]MDV7744212.1 glycosyltransferase family 2 protein [Enterococcus mundtii]PQC33185.1 glycosyltransferase [Enterococcus mundtii]